MGLTTAAGWRRTFRYSLTPAAVCVLIGALDRVRSTQKWRHSSRGSATRHRAGTSL